MSINHRRISLALASSLLLEIINKISPLLILHHAQKTLGLESFGWAQYQLALFETLQPLVTYGFANYALSHGKDDVPSKMQSLFSHTFILKLINASIVSLIFIAQNWGNLDLTTFGILLLVMGSCVIDAFWVCIIRHKVAAITLGAGLLRVVTLLLILTLVKDENSRGLFVFLSLIPNAAISLATGFYAYRDLAFAAISKLRLREIMLQSTPFALIVLMTTILDRFDIFLVEHWFSMKEAGIYAGPAKVVQSLSMIISSIALPFFAEILKVEDKNSLYKHVKLSLWVLSTLVAAIIFGLPFIENDVGKILFPKQPASASHLLSMLSIGMIGSIFLSVFGLQILLAKARPWALIRAGAIALILVPAMVWMTQESLGLSSVVYSIILGKIVMGMLAIYFAREFLPQPPLMSFFKPMLAGGGMMLTLSLLQVDGVLLNLLVGGLSYVLFLSFINLRELREILAHPKVQQLFKRT